MEFGEPLLSVFSDGDRRSPRLLPLEKSRETITTATGTTGVSEVSESSLYYRKKQPNTLEYDQLQLFKRVGLPVPADILWNTQTQESATSASGSPLGEVFRTSSANKSDLLYKAGQVLQEVHEVVNEVIVPEEILNQTYSNTAHIVGCFFYKYSASKRVGINEYSRHKSTIGPQETLEDGWASEEMDDFIPFDDEYHRHLQILVNAANLVAWRYKEALVPYVERKDITDEVTADFLTIPDQSLCYGDFKSENLLVDSECNMTLIDPLLSRGSTYFDVAKFTSRHMLDMAETREGLDLAPFFDGYGVLPTEDLKLYGPFTFSDLVCLDMLNISKSYLKRYAAGKKDYRMTAALDSSDFCLQTAAHITDLYNIK